MAGRVARPWCRRGLLSRGLAQCFLARRGWAAFPVGCAGSWWRVVVWAAFPVGWAVGPAWACFPGWCEAAAGSCSQASPQRGGPAVFFTMDRTPWSRSNTTTKNLGFEAEEVNTLVIVPFPSHRSHSCVCPFCLGADYSSKEGYLGAHLKALKTPKNIVLASEPPARAGGGRPWARSRSPKGGRGDGPRPRSRSPRARKGFR